MNRLWALFASSKIFDPVAPQSWLAFSCLAVSRPRGRWTRVLLARFASTRQLTPTAMRASAKLLNCCNTGKPVVPPSMS